MTDVAEIAKGNEPQMMLVPVAIREDVTVRLHFPADITRAEAEKAARVMLAYAPPATLADAEG